MWDRAKTEKSAYAGIMQETPRQPRTVSHGRQFIARLCCYNGQDARWPHRFEPDWRKMAVLRRQARRRARPPVSFGRFKNDSES